MGEKKPENDGDIMEIQWFIRQVSWGVNKQTSGFKQQTYRFNKQKLGDKTLKMVISTVDLTVKNHQQFDSELLGFICLIYDN
jgi:hypothetical protein